MFQIEIILKNFYVIKTIFINLFIFSMLECKEQSRPKSLYGHVKILVRYYI